MRLDPERSQITIRTEAEGLLSALAHDLEIRAHDVSGWLEGAKGELRVPVDGLRVVGAVKRGRVDPSVLTTRDKNDIERRIREEVLAGGTHVEVDAEVEGNFVALTVRAPAGKQHVRCGFVREGPRARGECALSLSTLGIGVVRGPMGAFRVRDRVPIAFDVYFVE
jgi:hypothetical protein